jgi:hypothetical protein
MYYFATSNFRDRAFFIHTELHYTLYIWFATRNIRDTEDLAKIYSSGIKVGLQYAIVCETRVTFAFTISENLVHEQLRICSLKLRKRSAADIQGVLMDMTRVVR